MSRIDHKKILWLAIPAMLAGVTEPLLNAVDTAIVGHIGTVELAGIGVATTLVNLIIWVLAQCKSSLSALTSRFLGTDNLKSIDSFLFQALLYNTLLGALLGLAASFFAETLLKIYAPEKEVLFWASRYFKIRILGLPFTLATFSIFGILRGFQNTSYAMIISFIGTFFNIGLDFLLVFGYKNFFSPIGFDGAAIASLIAQAIMFVISLWILLRKGPTLRFSFEKSKVMGEYIQITINLIARTLILNFVFFLAMRMCNGLGTVETAAYTIALNIWLFSSFFIDGFSSAANAISGKLFAAKEIRTLRTSIFWILKSNWAVAVLVMIIYTLGYQVIPTFFTKDPLVISAFKAIFWLLILAQPINAVAFTFDGVYKGLGKAKQLRNVLFFSTVTLFIPSIYIAEYLNLQLFGIWISLILWMIGRAAPLWWGFTRKIAPKDKP